MEIIKKNKLINGLIIHPYDSNREYFSKINIFYYSQDKKFAAGYWEAPIGWFDSVTKGFDEINYIIEGEIEALSEDKTKKIIVKEGDCFIVKNGDKLRWKIKKFTRTVFFIYPLTDELKRFFEEFNS